MTKINQNSRFSSFQLALQENKQPTKKCCTDLTLQRIALGSVTALATVAITAGVGIGLWVLSPTLFIGMLLVILFIPIGIPLLSSYLPQWSYVDYQNPKSFQQSIQDLQRLPFHKILKKHSIERLYKYGLIDEATRDKMLSLEKALLSLRQKYQPVFKQRNKEFPAYLGRVECSHGLFCRACLDDFRLFQEEKDRVKQKYSIGALASFYQGRRVINQEFDNFRK